MLNLITDIISKAQSGLLVVGAVKNKSARRALLKLGKILNWPLCADIASGLRQTLDP